MNYVKKIDAVRAFAVLVVVMSHWIPKTSKVIPFGEIGVDIFFVISGFLITKILITEKRKAESEGLSQGQALKNFVVRRALRIFPIYYLSLLVFWLMRHYESYGIDENLVYYLTYTSNILFFVQNAWDSYLAPLWSLAVEEQFYLVWPFLMLFVPERHTIKIIVLSIAIGIVFPYFFEREMVKVLTPSCMTALGSGALLAWMTIYQRSRLQSIRMPLLVIAIIAVAGVSAIMVIMPQTVKATDVRIVVTIFSVVWLMYCLGFYTSVNVVEWIMNNGVLIFIGQISYGIYLYHNLVSLLWKSFIVEHLGSITLMAGTSIANGLFIIAKFILLIVLAWMSYRFIERPFLNLKKYFVLESRPTASHPAQN
jgi:peptidoglycan/LPS O-acetylase OafA/YrhL